MKSKEELDRTQPYVPLPERLAARAEEPGFDLLEELERTQEYRLPEGEQPELLDGFYRNKANETVLKKMVGLAFRHSGYGAPIIVEHISFSENDDAFVLDVQIMKTGNRSKMTMDEFLSGLAGKDRATLDTFFAQKVSEEQPN